MKSFKKIVFVLLFPITILTSCFSGVGGCEMMFSNAENLGYISLNIASESWVPEKGLDSLLFINNKGVKCYFKIFKYVDENNKYELYLNNKIGKETCETKDYNFITCNFESYSLKNDDIPFSIDISRQLNVVERFVNDTCTKEDILNFSDKVTNRIAYSSCSFALIDSIKYKKSDRLFLDSTYKEVYELPCKADLSYGDALKFMYFQKGKGLIGFQFSNNDLWVRKAY